MKIIDIISLIAFKETLKDILKSIKAMIKHSRVHFEIIWIFFFVSINKTVFNILLNNLSNQWMYLF